MNKIAGALAILIAANVVLRAGIAAVTRNRLTDERDRLIRLRGYRAGYVTLAALMLLGLAALWLTFRDGAVQGRFMALHFLSVFYAMLILSEVVKTASQLVAYRRTA